MTPWNLLLTPVVPDPSGVGLARRAWSWVHELSTFHSLTTIVIGQPAQAHSASGILPGNVIYFPTRTIPRKSRRLLDWVYSDEVTSASLSSYVPVTKPSRVVIFRLYLHDMHTFLPDAWKDVMELDCDDLESRTRISLSLLAMKKMRFRSATEYFFSALDYAKIENAIPHMYRKVYLSAREDAHSLSVRNRLLNIVTRPNRIVTTAGSHTVAKRRPDLPPCILFVGSMGYLPNEDAALLIARSIAPLLRRKLPEVQLCVAGGTPTNLESILHENGIKSLGIPHDFSSVYKDSSVVIAPVRGGGGTKIKVLEAWLHRRPLVATRHAARGLDVIPGKHLLIAESSKEFADCCLRLINQPELAEEIANQGYDYLKERFLI